MDCTDYTPRGDYMVVMICIWYEGNNSTYHKVNSGCTDRSGGELSTQSIQGIPDSRADNLNNNKV